MTSVLDQYREPISLEDAMDICQEFARRHNLVLVLDGYVGFGRPAVYYRASDAWAKALKSPEGGHLLVEYEPWDMQKLEPIEDLQPGFDVNPGLCPNAYHKSPFIAILKSSLEDGTVSGPRIEFIVPVILAASRAEESHIEDAVEKAIQEQKNDEVEYDTISALIELAIWTRYLNDQDVEILEYDNGNTGFSALLNGREGLAIRKRR